MENQYNESPNLFDLAVNETVKSTFLAMAKWTRFLAIVGFAMMGIGVLWAFFFAGKIGELAAMSGGSQLGAQGAGMFKGMMIFITLVFCGLYFYPTYALLMYSTKIKKSLYAGDQQEFEKALNFLKGCFQYIAVLTIIVLVIYGGIFAMAMAAMAALGK